MRVEACCEVIEILGNDDKRVAVPVAARVAGPQANIIVKSMVCSRRFGERHYTCIVNHFG